MTPYTIRPVIWTHKTNGRGLAPIMIAVTIARKVTYFSTGLSVKPPEWKEGQVGGHANATLYNRTIRDKVTAIEKEILTRLLNGDAVTGKSLKAGRAEGLFSFVEELKKNKPPATRRRYDCEAGRFRNFGGSDLKLSDITAAFLRNYEANERKRGMAQNTLNTTFRWIKAILNKACRERLIAAVPNYTTPAYIQTERVYLTDTERLQWLNYWRDKKVSDNMYTTLTWFLLACYSGLRFSDWEQFDYNKRVDGNFLRLRAKKNGRWVVLPIGKTLHEIIEVAKDLPKPVSADKTRDHLKILAGRIECDKHVTTHTARHTAGCMFANLRLPIAVAAELLGVTERVAKVYYHLTGVDAMEQAAPLFDV